MLRLVLGNGMRLALGAWRWVFRAWGLTRLLAALLFEVKLTDVITFGLSFAERDRDCVVCLLRPARRHESRSIVALRYE